LQIYDAKEYLSIYRILNSTIDLFCPATTNSMTNNTTTTILSCEKELAKVV
jgi:hypothetical protein